MHKESILPRVEGIGCYCGGIVNWRVAIVHFAAKAVGLHVKIEGMPIGTSRNLEPVDLAECSSAQNAPA